MRNNRRNIVSLLVNVIKNNVQDQPTIEELLAECVQSSKEQWFTPTDDERLSAAVIATTLITKSQTDKDRLMGSWDSLRQFSAVMQALQGGVPVDIEKITEDLNKIENPVPIMKIWDENK